MEIDAHSLPAGSVLETDVCIIGSGPAGLTLARELGYAGRRTLVLESGSASHVDSAQRLNRGLVVGPVADLHLSRHRRVGGTTHLWNTFIEGTSGWAKFVPLEPRDFGVGDHDWPFGFPQLEPFYQRAQSVCGLGPFRWEADAWADRPKPALGEDLRARVYQLAHASRWTRDIPAEIRSLGCVTLLTGATATRVVLGTGGSTVSSVLVCTGSAQWSVRAQQIVLSAGAVENARLLLASGVTAATLGGGFMEHPRDYSLVLVPVHLDVFRLLRFFDAHRAADGTIICGRIAPAAGLLDAEALPSFSVTLLPRRVGRWHERVAQRWLHRAIRQPGHGWSERDAVREGWNGVRLVLNLEQRAHPANRVTLGRDPDSHGVPMPVLHWRWSAAEQAQLERIRVLLRDRFRSAGLGRLEWPTGAVPDPNAHHHAGTTRMHADPRYGVVNHEGRVHGVRNLWVAGASVFPSAGFANPTLTIVAMAIRLADRLRMDA